MKELLQKENIREIVSYVIIGGLTTLVGIGSYWILTKTVLDPENGVQIQIANCISWVLAVTFAYVTNRIFVFRSKNRAVFFEAVRFYAARVGTLLLDMLFMFLTVTIAGGNDKVMKIISSVIVTIVNYFLSKILVFAKAGDKDNENELN